MAMSINLVPFEHIDSMILNYLKNEVSEIFQSPVVISKKLSLPNQALSSYRNQYRAMYFLDMLQSLCVSDKVIGICDVDLYTKDTNFIFGLADPTRSVAVVSFARLKPISYGIYTADNLFLTRLLKEIIHELGHLYGLEHCHREECVMHFSISLIDIDIKDKRFCGKCHSMLMANS